MALDAEGEAKRRTRLIAGYGFSTNQGGSFSVPDELFSSFFVHVRSERLDGLLLRMWQDGAVELTPRQLQVFARAHREEMELALRLERAVLDATTVLAEHGIAAVALKGVALANTVYTDPAQRSFGDADLLIDPSQYVKGIELIVAAGAQRPLPEVRPGFDARFAKDVPVLVDGMTLDLHRTLIRGPFGERIPGPELIARSRSVELGGRPLPVLEPSDAYVFAGLTAGAADLPARLITLRDLLELERTPDFDADGVRRAAARWGVEAAVARAVRLVDEVLGPDDPPTLLAWTRAFEPSPLDRLYMSCYTSAARTYRSTLATLAAIPRWSDRVRFARALLLPQRAYREARGWSFTDHVRRGFTKLRR